MECTINGIPEWEHPKQIGEKVSAAETFPPLTPPRRQVISISQLLQPRSPQRNGTDQNSTSSKKLQTSSRLLPSCNISKPASTPKAPAQQQHRQRPPNTSMDHRAMLNMDGGVTPDRMLISFDSDSFSCCPSVGDITWDHSEAMAFHQSSMNSNRNQPLPSPQHPWQNFTEIPDQLSPTNSSKPTTSTANQSTGEAQFTTATISTATSE
jgi:hypothetical protein